MNKNSQAITTCWILTYWITAENKSMKEQIKNLTSVIEEGKVEYARITKELADTKINHAAAKECQQS